MRCKKTTTKVALIAPIIHIFDDCTLELSVLYTNKASLLDSLHASGTSDCTGAGPIDSRRIPGNSGPCGMRFFSAGVLPDVSDNSSVEIRFGYWRIISMLSAGTTSYRGAVPIDSRRIQGHSGRCGIKFFLTEFCLMTATTRLLKFA